MPTPRRSRTFPVRFNDARFDEDLDHVSAAARRALLDARRHLERDGVASHHLRRCQPDHRDGTDLRGMVKLYIPIPHGQHWGLVLDGARDEHGVHLIVIAAGARHPDRRPSVYDVAHQRLHGSWPPGMHTAP